MFSPQTLKWNKFLEHDNKDWNTPEMKYNVKNAFDKCVSLGFFTGLTSDCENENDTEK